MAEPSVYTNELSGVAGTAVTVSQNPARTPSPGGSTSAFGSPATYYERGSWRWSQDSGRIGSSSPAGTEERNSQSDSLRRGAELVVGLRKWEGRIVEVADGLLTVELEPYDHEGPDLVADFDIDLLGPDAGSAAMGDIIYLTTRTVRGATGYPYQTSSLKLRRPGPWAERELQEIRAAAEAQAEFFKGID